MKKQGMLLQLCSWTSPKDGEVIPSTATHQHIDAHQERDQRAFKLSASIHLFQRVRSLSAQHR
eukprot:scaffold3786_cov204-Alexandrium_tamarense.AAC.6